MSLLVNDLYRFGEFTLDPDQRILLREGKPLALTPKVFDTLMILVENSGRIVTKEELMTRLWPDSFVEETNLTFNIKQLRKTLGDDARRPRYIETVVRRGYRFIAGVEEVLSDKSSTSSQTAGRFRTLDVQSPDAAAEPVSGPASQVSEPAINSASENQAYISGMSLDTVAAFDSASTKRVGTRSIALAVALTIVLTCTGLVFWGYSNGLNKGLNNDNGVNGKSSASSPLKIEKLTGTGQSRLVAISPDGKYLAYTQAIEKRYSIWLRQLAANTNVEIVPPSGPIGGLAFTNSGEYLYFVRDQPTVLYRVSLLGGVPTRIVDKLQGKFSISSDDSQIAFVRQVINQDGQQESSLMIARSDGTGERTLFVGTTPNMLNVPLWSPDGQSIVCAYGNTASGSQDVRIVEIGVADGVMKELSAARFYQITKMTWLPNKSGLIISAAKTAEDSRQLWRVSYPGMQISQIIEGVNSYLDLSLTASADKGVASQATRISDIWVGLSRETPNLKKITQAIDNFCWTSDRRIVYSSTASGNRDIWIMQPNGTEQRQLTVNAGVNGTPAVTADNRYIVFISSRTGSFQVWRMDLDGSNQVQLTRVAGKNFPSISPDGRWVFYNTTDDWHLWKVSIDGGEPVQLTDYPAYCPSVSPDGKTIACARRTASDHEILILPLEGGQPLKTMGFSGGSFSGFRLQWTLGGKALIYAVEHSGSKSIIRQSLDGRLRQEIANLGEDDLFDFGYSFDGQFLAVTRGGWQHDVVLIRDLNSY